MKTMLQLGKVICFMLVIGACGNSSSVCDDLDKDGDGAEDAVCGGTDCDDYDPNRFPGNDEVCDTEGVDEDCDPSTIGEVDSDEDGYISSACCNGDNCGLDCDDTRAQVNLLSPEVCNVIDDDCDGDVDEGVLVAGFVDGDGDGFGDPTSPLSACPGDSGFANQGGDCDDTTPQVIPGDIVCTDPGGQNPGAFNLCQDNGTWTSGMCPNLNSVCLPQPGGSGVCGNI